jgi:hypothetical protein
MPGKLNTGFPGHVYVAKNQFKAPFLKNLSSLRNIGRQRALVPLPRKHPIKKPPDLLFIIYNQDMSHFSGLQFQCFIFRN